MPEAIRPLEFELRFHRGSYDIDPESNIWIENDERTKSLPDEPVGWDKQPTKRGDHPTISAIATRLNAMQLDQHYINYFFFPEVPDKIKS